MTGSISISKSCFQIVVWKSGCRRPNSYLIEKIILPFPGITLSHLAQYPTSGWFRFSAQNVCCKAVVWWGFLHFLQGTFSSVLNTMHSPPKAKPESLFRPGIGIFWLWRAVKKHHHAKCILQPPLPEYVGSIQRIFAAWSLACFLGSIVCFLFKQLLAQLFSIGQIPS